MASRAQALGYPALSWVACLSEMRQSLIYMNSVSGPF